MGALREAGTQPTNVSKMSQVMREKNESLREYLERPIEAYRTYMPFDPEAREHQSAVNMAFVNQVALGHLSETLMPRWLCG